MRSPGSVISALRQEIQQTIHRSESVERVPRSPDLSGRSDASPGLSGWDDDIAGDQLPPEPLQSSLLQITLVKDGRGLGMNIGVDGHVLSYTGNGASAAERAGIPLWSKIVAVNDDEVTCKADIVRAVRRCPPEGRLVFLLLLSGEGMADSPHAPVQDSELREVFSHHKRSTRSISRGTDGSLGVDTPPQSARRGAKRGKASGSESLVDRLYKLHEQKQDHMDALREEVLRQRQAKEDEEILKASSFRATPILQSRAQRTAITGNGLQRTNSPRGAKGSSAFLGTSHSGVASPRTLEGSPSKAPYIAEAMDRLCSGLGSKAAAMEAFRKIDKDNSGSLDQREFKLALKRLKLHLNERQLGLVMNHLDTDGDGAISIDEFMRVTYEAKLSRLRKKFQALSYSSGGQDWNKLFAHYDRVRAPVLLNDVSTDAPRLSHSLREFPLCRT